MTISSIRQLLGGYVHGDLSSFIEALLVWRERARQRRDLAMLDDRALQDIGLGRADVFGETMKPFWRR